MKELQDLLEKAFDKDEDDPGRWLKCELGQALYVHTTVQSNPYYYYCPQFRKRHKGLKEIK